MTNLPLPGQRYHFTYKRVHLVIQIDTVESSPTAVGKPGYRVTFFPVDEPDTIYSLPLSKFNQHRGVLIPE